MPFKSRKYNFTEFLTLTFITGKNGKTLHLLKQSAKSFTSRKKRKVIKILGSIQDYHNANKAGQNEADVKPKDGDKDKVEDKIDTST